MVPPADLIRTAKGAMAVVAYYQATHKVSAQLAAIFWAAFPEHYWKYSDAFAAGQWVEEDNGPWLRRVIFWKLQVSLHRDGLDEDPALCFPCGSYEGGELCPPDLEAKLK